MTFSVHSEVLHAIEESFVVVAIVKTINKKVECRIARRGNHPGLARFVSRLLSNGPSPPFFTDRLHLPIVALSPSRAQHFWSLVVLLMPRNCNFCHGGSKKINVSGFLAKEPKRQKIKHARTKNNHLKIFVFRFQIIWLRFPRYTLLTPKKLYRKLGGFNEFKSIYKFMM